VLDSFVEQDQPYLVLEHPADAPLADAIAHQPLTQSDALRVTHQIGGALVALNQQGLSHGSVSPQTILMRSGTPPMALLVGVTMGVASHDPARSPIGDMQDLARTLYSALTGQGIAADAIDVLAILHTLKQAQPDLNPLVEQAILQALQPSDHQPFSGIAHWLSTLPQPGMAISPHPIATDGSGERLPSEPSPLPQAATAQSLSLPIVASAPDAPSTPLKAVQPTVRSPHSASGRPKSTKSRWFPITVCVASVMAAVGGAGAGLMLRFDDPARPTGNGLLFNSEQSFPPSEEWPGTDMAETESSEYLFESPGWSSPTQTDYYAAPGNLPEYVPPGETDEFYPGDVYSEPTSTPRADDSIVDRSKPDIAGETPSPSELESDWSTDLPTEPSTDSKLDEPPALDPVMPDIAPSIPEPTFEDESSVTAPEEAEPLSRNPSVSEVVTQ
jgi:serine/threonine protein kinase